MIRAPQALAEVPEPHVHVPFTLESGVVKCWTCDDTLESLEGVTL